MKEWLEKSLDWTKHRQPVRVCRACEVVVVGHNRNANCPNCKREVAIDPKDGSMRPWDDPREWAPYDCLVVEDEIVEN